MKIIALFIATVSAINLTKNGIHDYGDPKEIEKQHAYTMGLSNVRDRKRRLEIEDQAESDKWRAEREDSFAQVQGDGKHETE